MFHFDELSLALIGNSLGGDGWAQRIFDGRGIFDKETRRKALAFATDAVYGYSKPMARGQEGRGYRQLGRNRDCS
jgi:hypothetical protein